MGDIKYALDINNIIKFCYDTEDAVNSDSEITDLYVKNDETNEFELTSKQLREVKTAYDSNKVALKFDLIKLLVESLANMSAISGNDMKINNFGEQLIINTIFTNGLIKEIK